MARRSPTNERYQKYTEPAGKTRKSAAAAKPSRKRGSTESVSSSAKSSSGAKGSGQRAPYDPPTPEFKQLRIWWWSLLAGGMVLVVASWAVRQFAHFPAKLTVASVALGLAYFCIAVAFYLDFVKMKPLRNEWRASQKKASK